MGVARRLLTLGAVVLHASACRGAHPVDDAVTRAAPQWPEPPELPRIRWRASVASPSDVGVRVSVVRRVWRALTGGHEPRLVQPFSVAVDSAGVMFVTDVGTRSVHVFDASRRRYESIEGSAATRFRAPTGVSTDDAGQLYVADAELGIVFALDARRRERWRAAGLARPTGVAWARGTRLVYVVETQGHRVRAYDAQGRTRLTFGERGEGPGQLNFPTHVVVATDGSLWITDALNFRVQHFTADGRFLNAFGRAGDHEGEFARPKGIAIDTEGHLYVVDGLYDVVNIFDSSGALLLTVGRAGRHAGEFWLASGVAIDRGDRIYVADAYNSRVQVLQYLPGQ